MTGYRAPLREYAFLLEEVYSTDEICATQTYAHVDQSIFSAVLEEAAKFAEGVLAPLNPPGQDAAAVFEDGAVKSPSGFPDAYRAFAEGGWAGFCADPDHGGQGLPHTLYVLVDEMMNSASMGFCMYRGLLDGAYRAIFEHGSDELKAEYLPRLASGELLPAMDLTEAHCGSDLSLLRTRAEPAADGLYKVTGTKIFISGGDHDLTRNILHLVLARLPDAPAGTRGISLFLVPKYYVDPATGAERRNDLHCGGIEHKMGLKASATCTMHFEGATGWLLGPPNGGLRSMFTMMNAARLVAGMQGVSGAEATLQIAAGYARDRRQGSAPGTRPGAGPDLLEKHPDIQRMIRIQKAYVEGGRCLAVQMAIALDLRHAAGDPAEREANDDLVQLLTPIVKAFLTEAGFESVNHALQVLGGHGYISESGIERWVRDLRIAQIYEGTNGIQALDLVGRKLKLNDGRLFARYCDVMKRDLESAADTFGFVERGLDALGALVEVTQKLGRADAQAVAWVATDYLRLFGLVALAGQWARIASVAQRGIANDQDYYGDKLETAAFYFKRMLPQYLGLIASIELVLDDALEDA
jgi:alkylation response protein AidB-like acyl-CoA dehydrogenase